MMALNVPMELHLWFGTDIDHKNTHTFYSKTSVRNFWGDFGEQMISAGKLQLQGKH